MKEGDPLRSRKLRTVEFDEDGIMAISLHKNLFMFKDEAFKEALKIPNACVLELKQSNSWNLQQIESEKN